MSRPKQGPGNRDASAGESPLFGRNKGKSAVATAGGRGTRLDTNLPSPLSPAVAGPLGYSFRNIPNFADNLDRVLAIQHHKDFNVLGNVHHKNNASTWPATSTIKWMTDRFWQHLYQYLHEKAQRRDGYRATDAPPLTNVYLPQYELGLILTLKVNIRVLLALEGAVFTNTATKSMLTAFSGTHERMMRDLEASNQLMYPVGLDPLIEYWSTVYTNYPEGAIVYNLFDFQTTSAALTEPETGSFTAWAAGNRPDLTLAADVAALLSDIELALSMIQQRNYKVAGSYQADADKWHSLLSMTGMGMPQTKTPGFVGVDTAKWIEQHKLGAFVYADDKGLGADTMVFWPDMRGDETTLINVNLQGLTLGPEDLFWIGGKGLIAFEADDDDTPGYTADANDLSAWGMVTEMTLGNGYALGHAERLYTEEDGWYEPATTLDFTAAAGVQAYLWSVPHVTIHPESWRAIMSEEAEEAYHCNFEQPGFQMPVDVFMQAHRKWSHDLWGLPFIT